MTTLDNKISLLCAVEYSSQSGKTGDAMAQLFETEIKILQVCLNCQKRAKLERNILQFENCECDSFCKDCFEKKTVCQRCDQIGQVSHIPSVRKCAFCIGNKLRCKRIVVVVLTSDCEQGNKTAFENIIGKIKLDSIDTELFLLSVIPDFPHVGKSIFFKLVAQMWG